MTNKIQNPKIKFWKLRFGYLNLFVICFLVIGIFPNLVFAHDNWRPGDAIVPPEILQNPSNYCQFLHLVKHLIDFILIVAAPVLATAFFVVAGVMMMLGGTNPGMLAQGKRIFKDTFIGLLIVMMAWLITNTLVRTIRGDLQGGQDWYEFICEEI